MKLAVFTSKYPAEVATFFERDMRALLEAGVEIDVFPIYPLQSDLWKYSLDILGPESLPRERVHHISFGRSLTRAPLTVMRNPVLAMRDAAQILVGSTRYGLGPVAKSAYALVKSWAWAADRPTQYDHVLAYWGNYAGSCAYAFHKLSGRGVPFTIWLHAGTDLYKKPIFLRQKMMYADNIITCCEFNQTFIRGNFVDHTGEVSAKVHVCHHGLDLARFPFTPDDRPANHVLAVGRLTPMKGFDYLLSAVGILAAQGRTLTLEIIGGGENRKALEAQAESLRISDRVTFRGWLPFNDTRIAMSKATMLVHPSPELGDGLPNVLREAMALGTPAIGSRVAGIPDALGDDCGVLVPPRDPESLAAAIAALIDNPAERRRLADNARRRVEQRYDMWQNGERLARLLGASQRQPASESERQVREMSA